MADDAGATDAARAQRTAATRPDPLPAEAGEQDRAHGGSRHLEQRRMPIPGERERNTLTYRQPGSMGGPAAGSPDAPAGSSSMDGATLAEQRKAGGGGTGPHKA